MYARAVDEAAARLHSLKHEQFVDLGLAAVVLALAVVAAELHPALALPLLLGGLFAAGSGMRAVWRRWDIVDRLAGERDAYVISEVRAYATEETTMDRRRELAELIRFRLRVQEPELRARVAPAAAKLGALASDLENDGLELDPACAVACSRLLTDVARSPFLDRSLPIEDLLSAVHQIRAGFAPR